MYTERIKYNPAIASLFEESFLTIEECAFKRRDYYKFMEVKKYNNLETVEDLNRYGIFLAGERGKLFAEYFDNFYSSSKKYNLDKDSQFIWEMPRIK